MAQFVFREELEQSSLKWQLRRLLEVHRVVNAVVLSLESGLPENEVRTLLDEMIASGEVHRLRPVGYNQNDMDFFRLCHLPRTSRGIIWHSRLHGWNRWIDKVKRSVRVPSLKGTQNAYA